MFILVFFFLVTSYLEASSKNNEDMDIVSEKTAEEIRNEKIQEAYDEIAHAIKGIYQDRFKFLEDQSKKEVLIFAFDSYIARISYIKTFPISESDTGQKEIFFIALKKYIKDLLAKKESDLFNENISKFYLFLKKNEKYILENLEKSESLYSHFAKEGRISVFFDPSIKPYSLKAFESNFKSSNNFIEKKQFYWNKDYQMHFEFQLKFNSDILVFFKENHSKKYFKNYFFEFLKNILKEHYNSIIDGFFLSSGDSFLDVIQDILKENVKRIPLNEIGFIFEDTVIDKQIGLDSFDFQYKDNKISFNLGLKNSFLSSLCQANLADIIQEKGSDNELLWKVSLSYSQISQELIDYIKNEGNTDFIKNTFYYLRFNNHTFSNLTFESEEEKNLLQSCYQTWEDLHLFFSRKIPKNVKLKDSSGNIIQTLPEEFVYPSFKEKQFNESSKQLLFYFK